MDIIEEMFCLYKYRRKTYIFTAILHGKIKQEGKVNI